MPINSKTKYFFISSPGFFANPNLITLSNLSCSMETKAIYFNPYLSCLESVLSVPIFSGLFIVRIRGESLSQDTSIQVWLFIPLKQN